MFSSIWQLAKSINIIDKYALSIKYISTIFMRIYTHWYAMSIKTMQFWSVSTSLFLLSEQFQSLNRTGECLRGGIIACLMDLQAIGGMPSRAVSLRGVQSSEGAQGRNTVCTLKRVQYQEGVQSTLAVNSLLYGTQTERGCWSQYTPGYQAEPITTDRYTIPLDSPIWRVRYIYRTWKYVNTY
jgi:hypothetical protein